MTAQTATTTSMSYFVVTGSFLTDHARDRVLSLGWTNAMRFLAESIRGMSMDEAASVLSGRKRFMGASDEGGVWMDDEDPEVTKKVLDEQRYHFAGMTQHDGVWWRSYAVVGLLRLDNVRDLPRRHRCHWEYSEDTTFARSRATYYMRSPTNDRAEFVSVDGCGRIVLFEPTGEGPPPWWPPAMSWQAAVDESVRGLEETGWDFEYESTSAAAWLKTSPRSRRGSPTGSQIRDLVGGLGISSSAADGIVASLTDGLTFSPYPVEPWDIGLHGYIAPDGTCWRCKYHGHRDLAAHLFPGAEDPRRAADEAGYVCIQSSAFGLDKEHKGVVVGEPTAAQKEAWLVWRAAVGDPSWELLVL